MEKRSIKNAGNERKNSRRWRLARQLLKDPYFLYKAGQKIGELGVVGEERNRLIIFLAGLACILDDPASSTLAKGSTSSGKSTLVRDSLQLFPPSWIIQRAGLSAKALAYGKESLAHKILFICEYRCGKDAQLLLRLLQSEGQISHEATSVRGTHRSTRMTERVGTPVVLTTTTDEEVYADDETRFLSVWVDESPAQTRAILKAQAGPPRSVNYHDLRRWRTAISMIQCKSDDFQNPPSWLQYVAEQLPTSRVRSRRDWQRTLTFLRAVALCRAVPDRGSPLNITFEDYCVTYAILEPVLASTLRGLRTQELLLSKATAALNTSLERAVTVGEIAKRLKWKKALVYKYVKSALKHRLVEYESGTRERNEKRLLSRDSAKNGFLPRPDSVLSANPEIGAEVRYVHPLTGKVRILRRKPE